MDPFSVRMVSNHQFILNVVVVYIIQFVSEFFNLAQNSLALYFAPCPHKKPLKMQQ